MIGLQVKRNINLTMHPTRSFISIVFSSINPKNADKVSKKKF